ncbi:MAG: tryptophan 2,3-dioxygenase family protein [Bacteroidota bacterium]
MPSITYQSYLNIDKLLTLQQLQSSPEEHDETLFIIIHQTYELWFKQILHELNKLMADLSAEHTWGAAKTMRRVLTILKTCVSQIDILETMTPLEFNSFRAFLGQSSGFQSYQFRELEIRCGLRHPHLMVAYQNEPSIQAHLEQCMTEPTLWESFCAYLAKKGTRIACERTTEQPFLFTPSLENQQKLIEVMRSEPESAMLAELFIDFDEGLQEWRYRHVKMVQRTIGTKKGTGGSDGAGYLMRTINQPIFPDLWEMRTLF